MKTWESIVPADDISFNSDLLKDQRKTREKLIDMAIKELEDEKTSLLDAKKSRNLKLTEYKISEILRKRGVQSFIDTKLESNNLSGKTGSSISSLNLTYEINIEAIKKSNTCRWYLDAGNKHYRDPRI